MMNSPYYSTPALPSTSTADPKRQTSTFLRRGICCTLCCFLNIVLIAVIIALVVLFTSNKDMESSSSEEMTLASKTIEATALSTTERSTERTALSTTERATERRPTALSTTKVSLEEDTTIPVIANCPTDITQTVPVGTPSAVVTWTAPTATDNVTPFNQITVFQSHSPGRTFNVGTTTQVAIVFVDLAGNQATCTFNVIVTAGELAVSCPPAQSAVASFTGTIPVYFDESVARATGGSGSYSYTFSTPSGSSFSASGSPTSVTVTARDNTNAALTGTCHFNVNVKSGTTAVPPDNLDPLLVCPNDIVLTTSNGSAIVTYDAATIYNSAGISNSYAFITGTTSSTGGPTASGSSFPLGTHVLTVTGRDSVGNVGTCSFTIAINVQGQTAPTISGCNANSSATLPDVDGQLQGTSTTTQLTWNAPTAGTAPVMTIPNGVTGSFSKGLTTIQYIFGSAGAQSVCTWYVYVRGATDHPCFSSPCIDPNLPQCFYNNHMFLCMTANASGRRRRDTEVDGCDASCHLNGGVCETNNDNGETFPPTCFLPASSADVPVEDPCDVMPCFNNASCVSGYDSFMYPTVECGCPPGVEGRNCEHLIHYDDRAIGHFGDNEVFAFWFITIALGILGMVVLLLGAIVCRLVTVRVIHTSPDEKVLIQ